MMKRRTWVLAALLACGTAGAADADWIVTHNGERFEIKGTWQVKGKLVIFNLPDGTLSSMRASLVDVDASRLATEQAKKDAAAPPPAADDGKSKRKSVIVLTDKDFQKTPAVAPDDAGATKDAKDAKDAKDKAPSRDAVEIVNWDRVPATESKADGVELAGLVRNASQNYFTELTVVASLYDETGNIVARVPATVDTPGLGPSESSRFHLVASGVFAFSTIKFDTQWKGVKSRPAAPPATTSPTTSTTAPSSPSAQAPSSATPAPPPASPQAAGSAPPHG